MNRRPLSRRAAIAWRLVLVALLSGAVMSRLVGPASASYAEIEGSGSTWAYTIVQQWIADVSAAGMQVTFNNNGSSQGRKDFANNVTDFGDSDIPYQGVDPITKQADASTRPYAYLPVVAGGTSFTYHLTVAGKLVKNLRLSGETIAKIFTNQITNWNDPEITKENGGHALPSLPITPVVRSDGSGATAQFTLWMDHEYPSIWRPYNGAAGLTSLYPRKGRQIASSGDDGVMNTVDSAAGNGTIGYAEYSYPLNAHYPVAYVENAAGYYVQPTQYNVAVALTKAQINGCNAQGVCSPTGQSANTYLTQNLDAVYTFKDPRSYPVSSYSYMIIPTSKTDQRMNSAAKRQTLADFLSYSLCTGQSKAGPYGYSPLPLNLVRAAFSQVEKLGPQAVGGAFAGVNIKDPSANLATCDNPTFVKGNLAANHLAQVAPMPLACQKATAQPCGDAVVPPGTGAGNGAKVSTNSTGGTAGTTGTTPAGAGNAPAAGAVPAGGSGPDPATGAAPDPATGIVPAAATGSDSGATATANAVNVSAERSGDNKVFGGVAVLELLAIVLIPGVYVAWLRRRRGGAA